MKKMFRNKKCKFRFFGRFPGGFIFCGPGLNRFDKKEYLEFLEEYKRELQEELEDVKRRISEVHKSDK